MIIVPAHAEKEIGFPFWLTKVWNIAKNSSAKLIFFATKETKIAIDALQVKNAIAYEFTEFKDWSNFLALKSEFQKDDNLVIVLSRKDKPSYDSNMSKIPSYLNKYFNAMNYLLIYPMQVGEFDRAPIELTNPTLIEPFDKIDELGKSISKIFKRK